MSKTKDEDESPELRDRASGHRQTAEEKEDWRYLKNGRKKLPKVSQSGKEKKKRLLPTWRKIRFFLEKEQECSEDLCTC